LIDRSIDLANSLQSDSSHSCIQIKQNQFNSGNKIHSNPGTETRTHTLTTCVFLEFFVSFFCSMLPVYVTFCANDPHE